MRFEAGRKRLLCGFRIVEEALEVLEEEAEVESVDQCMVDVDGDGHGETALVFSDFAEGDARG